MSRKVGTNYDAKRHLTGPMLLAGSTKFLPLEIPEIENEDGEPMVVFFKHLSAKDVLTFTEGGATINPNDPARGRSQLNEILALVVKAVVYPDGKPMYTEADIDALAGADMRIINRLSNAVINLMRNRPLDAPPEVADAAPGNAAAAAVQSMPSPEASSSPTV